MAVDGLHVLLAQLCTAADLPTDWELLTNAGYAAELILWDPAGTPVGRLALNLAEPDDDGPTTTEHAPVLAGALTPASSEAAPTVSRAKALVAELLSGAAFDPTPPSTTGCVTVQYLGHLVIHWAFGLAVALRLGPYICVVQHNPFCPRRSALCPDCGVPRHD